MPAMSTRLDARISHWRRRRLSIINLTYPGIRPGVLVSMHCRDTTDRSVITNLFVWCTQSGYYIRDTYCERGRKCYYMHRVGTMLIRTSSITLSRCATARTISPRGRHLQPRRLRTHYATLAIREGEYSRTYGVSKRHTTKVLYAPSAI